MKTKIFPLISIIISNYNGVKLNILQECLENFVKIDYPNYEILLVDNNSVDKSISVARNIFGNNPKFRVIKNPINMYSQGINLGFQEAKGEYIALFNNDIAIKNGYLQKLLEAFQKHPKLAVAQGKLLWFADPSIIDSVGETMDIYGNPVTLGYKTRDGKNLDKEEEVLSATGAACLIKKTALKIVGGYDDKFGIGYEDMDHCLRFRQKGFIVMRVPSAIALHKRGVTDLSDMVRVKVRWHFNKNRLATMIRNYPLGLLLKTIPITIVIYLCSYVWEMIVYRNQALALTRIQAIFWILKNLPQLIKERSMIRKGNIKTNDKKMLKLFAKADIFGKVKAVILDRFSLMKIRYSLPWTYPAEIKSLIPSGSTVLDIGCGTGHLTEWINYSGNLKVVGVDINQADLNVAKKRLTEKGRPVFQELHMLDITKKIPFKDKFDIVLCSQVVEHLKKEDALALIRVIEKLAKKRIIIATINGFFQFNHRLPGEHDVHLSGWSAKEFGSMGYRVRGSGLKFIYKPGALKDHLPKIFHLPLFFISYVVTPLLRFFHPASLLLISYKDINEKA